MKILQQLSHLVTKRQTQPILELFQKNIRYDDTIYGLLEGKKSLEAFFDSWWRDGLDYRWQFSDVVSQGDMAYASFRFFYIMKSKRLQNPQIDVGGMCRLKISENKIIQYKESINAGEAMMQMGLPAKLIKKQLEKLAGLPRL